MGVGYSLRSGAQQDAGGERMERAEGERLADLCDGLALRDCITTAALTAFTSMTCNLRGRNCNSVRIVEIPADRYEDSTTLPWVQCPLWQRSPHEGSVILATTWTTA